MDGEGEMDLTATIGQAVDAARRGDVDALETELTRLRRLNAESAGALGTRLRTMARCVRDHPSFTISPAAQTG